MSNFDKITGKFGKMLNELEAVEGRVEKELARVDKKINRWISIYNRMLKFADDKVTALNKKIQKLDDYITSIRTDVSAKNAEGVIKKRAIVKDAKKCKEAAENFRKMLG